MSDADFIYPIFSLNRENEAAALDILLTFLQKMMQRSFTDMISTYPLPVIFAPLQRSLAFDISSKSTNFLFSTDMLISTPPTSSQSPLKI